MATIDFGNIVNRRKPSAEDRFLHRPIYGTCAELAYDCRARQVAQLLHMIGEALQCRQPDMAVTLCQEAEQVLAGLRAICGDGKFN